MSAAGSSVRDVVPSVRQSERLFVVSNCAASHANTGKDVDTDAAVLCQATFSLDDTLPSLPLPSLRDTLDRYLESVRAVASHEQYLNTCQVVDQFETGDGRRLHALLQQRAENSANWISEWWDEYSYLRYRGSLMPCMRFAGAFTLSNSLWPPSHDKHCLYMARYLHWLGVFWTLLRSERLKGQRSRDGAALCMNQWRYLFSCVRLPGHEIDQIQPHFRTEEEGASATHMLVTCQGRMFRCHLIDPHSQQPLSIEELHTILCHVWHHVTSASGDKGQYLAALTSDLRPRWHKNRQYLCTLSPHNISCLREVETAVCHVILDTQQTEAQADSAQVLSRLLTGNVASQWLDHCNTLIVLRDGRGGTVNDHSPMDAMVAVSCGMFCHTAIYDDTVTGRLAAPPRRHLCQPVELVFDVDADIKKAVETALSVSLPLAGDVEVACLQYTVYGKLWITSQRMHPDAFVQAALHLTYYRLHHRPGAAYETASTRRYYRGRTETVRSCSTHMMAFCRAMTSQCHTKADCCRLLHIALQRHQTLAQQAAAGQGCDRHLLALKILALQHRLHQQDSRDDDNHDDDDSAATQLPDIFTDPMWTLSGGDGQFVLSTSTLGYSACNGVTPAMTLHGYGCFYSFENHWLTVNISSYRSSELCFADKFGDMLESSLSDMQQVVLSSSRL